MVDITLTVMVPQLVALTEAVNDGVATLCSVFAEGMMQMADSSEQLTQAMQTLAAQVTSLTMAQRDGLAALQAEIAQITVALVPVENPAVETAVEQLRQVQTQLATLQSEQEQMTSTIKGIIPD